MIRWMEAVVSERPVSGLERIWLAAARICPPYAPAWVLEGEGPLEPAGWARALAAVAAARPLLGARLAGVGRRLRWVPGGPPPALRVAPGAWDGQGGARWLQTPLRPGRDPLVELVLLPDAGRLALRAHHALLDGRGLWQLLGLIARAARGEALPPPQTTPDEGALARAAGVAAAASLPADVGAPLPPVGHDARIHWARRSGPVPAQPLAWLARGLVDQAGRRLRLSLPVDLRGPADAEVLHNLTGIAHLELRPGEALLAVAEALRAAARGPGPLAHARAADALRGVPLWLMTAVGRGVARRSLARDRWPASAVLSNLGRVDPPACAALGFQPRRAFLVPPGHPGVPLFLTAAGGPEGLELCGAGPLAVTGGGRLEALLEALLAPG